MDDKDSWNGTGLIRSAERGHAAVVGRLLRAGVDRDHVNRIGYQAIHEAVWLGKQTPAYLDTVRALAAAAASGDADSVALALRIGAPVHSRDASGRTALELAIASGHEEAARLLRIMGAA